MWSKFLSAICKTQVLIHLDFFIKTDDQIALIIVFGSSILKSVCRNLVGLTTLHPGHTPKKIYFVLFEAIDIYIKTSMVQLFAKLLTAKNCYLFWLKAPS